MASVKLYLDKRNKKVDGTFPLKLTITHKKPFHIPLDISIPEENWVNNKIGGNFKKKSFYNNYIQSRLTAVENCLLTLNLLGKLDQITSDQLKKIIEDLNSPENTSSENTSFIPTIQIEQEKKILGTDLLFGQHAKTFIATRQAQRTRELYEYTLKMLQRHYELHSLTFGQIDYNWLEDLRLKLAQTSNKNTQSIHFRNIRAIYKDANKRKLVSKDLYPFDGFHIGDEETMHRDLSVEELRKLLNYPVEQYQECYRDLFMLQFYLIGINLIDLLHATDIRNGRLNFRRAKTHKIYSIKIPPEAMAIMKKYSPGEKYLLNFLDNYKNYKDFMSRYNRNLKQIGPWKWEESVSENGRPIKKKKIDPIIPFLSSYYSRHTWATFAAELDIPEQTIRMALGHGKKTVTDIYINYNVKKVDQANQKVIDYLHGKIDSPNATEDSVNSEKQEILPNNPDTNNHQAVRRTLVVVGGLMSVGKGNS